MLEYIAIIISFVLGGGLSTILTIRFVRKNSKIDYTEKAIQFIEQQYDLVLKKNKELEIRITELELLIPIACFNRGCKTRQKDDSQ